MRASVILGAIVLLTGCDRAPLNDVTAPTPIATSGSSVVAAPAVLPAKPPADALPVVINPAPEPPAAAPEPDLPAPFPNPAPTPAPPPAPAQPAPVLPVNGVCPTGLVAQLAEIITCVPPTPPIVCPPGTQPVLHETITCEK